MVWSLFLLWIHQVNNGISCMGCAGTADTVYEAEEPPFGYNYYTKILRRSAGLNSGVQNEELFQYGSESEDETEDEEQMWIPKIRIDQSAGKCPGQKVEQLEIGMNLAVSARSQEIYMSHGLVSVTVVTNSVQSILNATIVKMHLCIFNPGLHQSGTCTNMRGWGWTGEGDK